MNDCYIWLSPDKAICHKTSLSHCNWWSTFANGSDRHEISNKMHFNMNSRLCYDMFCKWLWFRAVLQEMFLQCTTIVDSVDGVGGSPGQPRGTSRAWSYFLPSLRTRPLVSSSVNDCTFTGRFQPDSTGYDCSLWFLAVAGCCRAKWRIQAELERRTDSYLERETRSAPKLMFMDLRGL